MSKGCRGEKFWWSGVYSSGVPLRNHLREFWWNWILPGSTKKLSQRILGEVILPGFHQETISGNSGGAYSSKEFHQEISPGNVSGTLPAGAATKNRSSSFLGGATRSKGTTKNSFELFLVERSGANESPDSENGQIGLTLLSTISVNLIQSKRAAAHA